MDDDRRRARRDSYRWDAISFVVFLGIPWLFAYYGHSQVSVPPAMIAAVFEIIPVGVYFVWRSINDRIDDLHLEIRALRERIKSVP